MITLNQEAESENIVLTLTEKSTLADPTYRIECTHVTNNTTVSFELGEDLSGYKTRYNEFTVLTSTEFLNAPEGQYLYKAIENISEVVVEVGKLQLNKESGFSYSGYEEITRYKGYSG